MRRRADSERSKHGHSKMKLAPWQRRVKRKILTFLANANAGKDMVLVAEAYATWKKTGKEIVPVAEDNKAKTEIVPVVEDEKVKEETILEAEDDAARKKVKEENILEAEDDAARRKVIVVEEEIPEVAEKGGGSKKRFQQIWSKEDEKEILKGLADFATDTGLEGYKECEKFHEYLKKRKPGCAETSTSQLKEKIRRMKRKFVNHLSKRNSKLDQESLKLSHRVWAREAQKGKLPAKKKASQNEPVSARFLGPMDDDFWKWAVGFLDRPTSSELEQRWSKLRSAELELNAKRAELVSEQALAIANAFKSSN